MSISKLGEAKRLHAMGLAIHWLRPNSKVPVKAGWTTGERDSLKTLQKEYQKGYNVGTKLGTPSKIGSKYLAAIDVDIKGTNPKYRKQAEAWIEEHFPGLLKKAPRTLSGRGNGSMHVWVLVDSPIDSRKLTSSSEFIEVHMPSVKASRKDIEELGDRKIKEGFRQRPAWEVDFMCEGRQVVLPPSIHPDSGKAYKWGRTLENVKQLSVIDIDEVLEGIPQNKNSGRPKGSSSKGKKFDIVDVDEFVLEQRLKSNIVTGIYEGEDVSDRSAFCFTVALSMVRAKFTDAEILGVLTNKEYYIGEVGYEHAKTSNRQRAARWLYDYCILKARQEADAAFEFDCEVKVYDTLEGDELEEQVKRLKKNKSTDWKKKLDRTDSDNVKPTFKNVKLIIENVIGSDTFIYDEFSRHHTYGRNTVWGGVKGAMIEDADEVRIKDWFAHNWKIEPNTNLVSEVILQMSLTKSFHPVKEYLESLEWDGVSRINTWMKDYLGAEADSEYLKQVSRKFLIAAVARIYEPGKKFDSMPILEGRQGAGKSTVGRILAGEKWFYDSDLNLHDKDSALNLQGQWLVEMGELANINRADVRVIKSFVVRQVDKVRPPYGKRMIESARQCVFFGTTNDDSYLKDKTGNRRFWPIKVNEIDLKGLKEVRDQLWAEALFNYDLGEQLYLDKEVEETARGIQESRLVEDASDIMLDTLAMWKEQVLTNRRNKKKKGKDVSKLRFKLSDLFDEFSDVEWGEHIQPPLKEFKVDNNLHLQWAAMCLKKLGFEKYIMKGRGWWRLESKKKG